LGNAVLDELAMLIGHLRDPGTLMRDGRAWRDVAKISLDSMLCFSGCDVAGYDDDSIRWRVVSFEPLAHIVERGRIEVFHRADDCVGVWMLGWIGGFDDQLFDDGIGLIVALALFVLDDTALQIEDFLAEG